MLRLAPPVDKHLSMMCCDHRLIQIGLKMKSEDAELALRLIESTGLKPVSHSFDAKNYLLTVVVKLPKPKR